MATDMPNKHKNIYLVLALACFLGIVLIFVFDGYIGLYDSLVLNNIQYQETITADQWEQREKYGSISIGVERGGKVEFTYTIENHRFSEYTSSVDASLWNSGTMLKNLKTENVQIKPFGKGEIKWTLDTMEYIPENYPSNQNYNVDVVIKNGERQRKVQVFIYSSIPSEKIILP